MKKIAVLVGFWGVLIVTSDLVLADGEGTYLERQDRIFARQSLCVGTSSEQVKAEKAFKEMYIILKQDVAARKRSVIEATTYAQASSALRNNSTGIECVQVLHGSCYSVFCEKIF